MVDKLWPLHRSATSHLLCLSFVCMCHALCHSCMHRYASLMGATMELSNFKGLTLDPDYGRLIVAFARIEKTMTGGWSKYVWASLLRWWVWWGPWHCSTSTGKIISKRHFCVTLILAREHFHYEFKGDANPNLGWDCCHEIIFWSEFGYKFYRSCLWCWALDSFDTYLRSLCVWPWWLWALTSLQTAVLQSTYCN